MATSGATSTSGAPAAIHSRSVLTSASRRPLHEKLEQQFSRRAGFAFDPLDHQARVGIARHNRRPAACRPFASRRACEDQARHLCGAGHGMSCTVSSTIGKHIVLRDFFCRDFCGLFRFRAAFDPLANAGELFLRELRLSLGRHAAAVDHDPQHAVIDGLRHRRFSRLPAPPQSAHRRQIQSALLHLGPVALAALGREQRLNVRFKHAAASLRPELDEPSPQPKTQTNNNRTRRSEVISNRGKLGGRKRAKFSRREPPPKSTGVMIPTPYGSL